MMTHTDGNREVVAYLWKSDAEVVSQWNRTRAATGTQLIEELNNLCTLLQNRVEDHCAHPTAARHELKPVHWERWGVLSPNGELRRVCLTEGDACETACGDEDVQRLAVYPINAVPATGARLKG